jgi:hypothetical protein
VQVSQRTGIVNGHVPRDGRASLANVLHQRGEIVFEDQHFRASEWFSMATNSGGVSRTLSGITTAMRQHYAIIAFQQRGVVEAQIRHPVAGPDAFGHQPRGQPFAALAELGVGRAAGARHHAHFTAI